MPVQRQRHQADSARSVQRSTHRNLAQWVGSGVSDFRANQRKFQREREEHYKSTMAKVR
jgi:hypothetical protein